MERNRAVQTVSRILMLVGIATAVISVSGFKSLSTGARSAQLRTNDRFSPVNVRVSPSVQSKALHIGFTGDRVKVLSQQSGSDGRMWYQVRFENTGATGWVRGDFVALDQHQNAVFQPVAIAPAPRTAAITRPSSTELPRKVPQDRSTLSQEQIDYFLEVALGSEFHRDANPTLRKWRGDIHVQYFGNPTPADLKTLQTVIAEINALTNSSIRLQLVNSNPNMRVYFVPESQFKRYEPGYVPVNYGFFMTYWDADNTIRKANILINSQNVTQQERSHLIREELTQSLGLMQDSFKYADSMFYQPWTNTTQYSALDRALIQMLYHPDIRPGMTRAEVITVLNGYQAQGKSPLKF